MSDLILPREGVIYQVFERAARTKRMVFMVGLPGTGKSLLIQQLALMARAAGRVVHLLQWDVTRAAFETAEALARYPEVDGVTHAAIRKGVGLWAREGVARWHETYPEPEHFLLGEIPLIGNRLVELTRPVDDAAEPLLSGEEALFLVPVPSRAVRAVIEATREGTIARPRHEKENRDAPPNVLRAIWREVAELGCTLGLTAGPPPADPPYDPDLYAAVFSTLLRERPARVLAVETVLRPNGSAYDLTLDGTELKASPEAVSRILADLEKAYEPETLNRLVENWHRN